MAEAGDTTITIAADVARLLRDAIEAGGYTNPSDAIRDALLQQDVEQESDLFGYSRAELDRLIDEADASGISTLTNEEITREGFRRAGVPYPAG